MTTMMLAKVNRLFLAIILSFPPVSGLNQLDLLNQGEGGDVQDDQGGGDVQLFNPGQEGELLDGGGEGGGGGALHFDPHTEDGGGQGGGEEGIVQLAPPGRGGGVGQDCGGPARQWGVWGGRWKSLSLKSDST